MSKPETYQAKMMELGEEQARELRRIGRETAELRKIFTKIYLILQAQEVARLELLEPTIQDLILEYHGDNPATPAGNLETD